jgi:hypothetical protein
MRRDVEAREMRRMMRVWRMKSGSSGDRNPRTSNDDYINVLPDFLCQLFFDAH